MGKGAMFPFEWVPERRWREEAGCVFALEVEPEAIQPAVSVQASWNRSRGIVRGCKIGDVLVEDHICETLDDEGRLVRASEHEGRIFGSQRMRAQVWTAERHLAVYRETQPSERVLAWVGNGNLLNNPHFVAFDGSSIPHRLYHLVSEIPYLRRSGRRYSCLIVRRPTCAPRVSIESVFFEYDRDGQPEIYSADEQQITHEVEFATYGQTIVEKGRCIEDADLIRMVGDGEFYDLRHIFLFGRVETGPDQRLDAGLAGLWGANGNIDTGAVERAIHGEPITSDVRQLAPDLVHRAMSAKGYHNVANPKTVGEYSLESGFLRVVLRRGIYPHSMIGIRKDGSLILVAIRGFSNRVGITVQGGAEIMRLLGAETALLIDNGGDVMMCFDGEMVLSSSEGQRDRLRSIILLRTARPSVGLRWSDLRLTRYARQYADVQSG